MFSEVPVKYRGCCQLASIIDRRMLVIEECHVRYTLLNIVSAMSNRVTAVVFCYGHSRPRRTAAGVFVTTFTINLL